MKDEHIIVGYSALIKPTPQQLYFKIFCTLHNYTKNDFELLVRYAQAHPNMISANESLGSVDFEISVLVSTTKALYAIIADLKQRFSFITNTSFFEYIKVFQCDYLPKELVSEINAF